MSMSTTISCFIYALTGGGAQRRTLDIVNALAGHGYAIELVVVSGEGPLVGQLDPRVRLHVLRSCAFGALGRWFPRWRLRGLETAASVPALARHLRRSRPDVLLSAANHVNLVAVLAHRLARVRTRLVLRTSNHPSGNLDVEPRLERCIRRLLRATARRIYPWADAVIAVSDGVADDLSDLTGIARGSITTIYNPVVSPRLDEQQREPLSHRWLGQDVPVLLGVGTLKLQKDFPTLLHAFAEVRRRRRARLVILGDGPARERLVRLASHLGVADDVEFQGYVGNPYAWMSRASLLVLSSRWEGLPGVLIEAMACGCPVVSTDCPSGPAEILEHGAWGPLVAVGDVQGLARAIEQRLDQPPDRLQLRKRASDFSMDRAIARYIEILLPGAAGGSSGGRALEGFESLDRGVSRPFRARLCQCVVQPAECRGEISEPAREIGRHRSRSQRDGFAHGVTTERLGDGGHVDDVESMQRRQLLQILHDVLDDVTRELFGPLDSDVPVGGR